MNKLFTCISAFALAVSICAQEKTIRIDYKDALGGYVRATKVNDSTYSMLATPNSGYIFLKWGDELTTNPRNVIKSLNSDDHLYAVFVRNEFNHKNGYVDVQITDIISSKFIITAIPRSCATFVGWNDGTTAAMCQYSKDDCDLLPVFETNAIKKTVTKCVGGTIDYREDTCQFTLTAVSAVNYVFDKWENGDENPVRVVPYVPDTVTASFIPYVQYFTISDWLDSKVVIRSNMNLDGLFVRSGIGEEFTSPVTSPLVKVDEGVYEVYVTTIGGKAGSTLQLRLLNECDELLTVQSFIIPNIITGSQTSSTINSLFPVYVTRNAKLTINGSIAVPHVVVYGDGKLIVPGSSTLIVDSILLKGGSVENGVYQYVYPQLSVEGSLINHSNDTIYYDYLLNNQRWYPVSLPDTIVRKSIRFMSGASAVNRYIAEYYDGEIRSTGMSGWRDVSEKRLIQGHGYNVFAMPESIKIEGVNKTRKYSRLRFPIPMNLANGEEDAPYIKVVAYGIDSRSAQFTNIGWNFVANPFATNYAGELTLNGNYVNYVTIPADDGQSYTQDDTESTTLPAFRNFFIQVEESGSLMFYRFGKLLNAPWRKMQNLEADSRIGIVLSGCGFSDKVGIRYGDSYTDEYEINADLSKFTNANINAYAIINGQYLAFAALDKSRASIPLGYSVNLAGTYKFSLNSKYDSSSWQNVLLYDSEEKITTDLLVSDYSFYANKEKNDSRFVLYCVDGNSITTDVKDAYKYNKGINKQLQNGQLYIINGSRTYNAQGQQVK